MLRKSFTQIKAEVAAALSPNIAETAAELAKIARSHPDPRAQLVAIKMQWDMLREAMEGLDAETPKIDVTKLTAPERDELRAALTTLQRLADKARGIVNG